MGYTIKELAAAIDRKPAMIYNYFKESDESKAFYYTHREARKKGGFLYNDEVLERLKKRVGVENAVPLTKNYNEEEEIPEVSAPSAREEELAEKVSAYEKQIEELKGEYEKVSSENARLLDENKELLKQNGNLLLLLSQEKQEKQALLPPPRKTIKEKIKELFNR